MNPELSAINNLDRRKRPDDIKDVADKLLKNAEKVRQRLDEIAFDPRKFEDLYSKENVDRDLRYVDDMEKIFNATANNEVIPGLTERDVKEISERVEYEVIRGINMGQWFDGVTAYKTAKPDDIRWGMDAALEMREGNSYSHLGMGIDVTFANNVGKKMKRIKDEIDYFDGEENRLGRIKYFESKDTGIRGELSNLPRVIIAVDLPMLMDMTTAKDPEVLHGHISRHIALLEMQHQLQIYSEYAHRKNPPAAKPYERGLSFINPLVEELHSEDRVRQSEYTRNRRADDAINVGLELFSI